MSYTGFKAVGAKTTVFGHNVGSHGEDGARGILGRFAFAMRVRRERLALLELDDAMLKDIGLSRYDVEREAGRSLFDLPTQNPTDRRYRV